MKDMVLLFHVWIWHHQVQNGNFVVCINIIKLLILSHHDVSIAQWHRFPDGRLDRGELHRDVKCNTVFEIFTPYPVDLIKNRQILIVCRNPHSHPPPAPVKTPPVYLNILKSILLEMRWKLADATPRRILLDTGFMTKLRSELGWSHARDPLLTNLHYSFANMDHVLRIILDLRGTFFACGTGFAGMFLV